MHLVEGSVSQADSDPLRFQAGLQDSNNRPIFFFCHSHFDKTDDKAEAKKGKNWPDLSAVNFTTGKKGKDRAPGIIFSVYKGQDVEKDGKPVRYWTQRNLRSTSRILPKQMSLIEYLESPSTEGATSPQRHTRPTGSPREVVPPSRNCRHTRALHPSLRRHRLFSLRLAPSMLTL